MHVDHNMHVIGWNMHITCTLFHIGQLLRFLHINSIDGSQVSTTPNYDRLYKVRKLLDIIVPIFLTTHQEVSIDEAIPFQGRLGFKQYMKDKPTK